MNLWPNQGQAQHDMNGPPVQPQQVALPPQQLQRQAGGQMLANNRLVQQHVLHPPFHESPDEGYHEDGSETL